MKLELNFDESIYRKQIELLYNSGYGKKSEYYKNSHYLGFGFLIVGVWSIIDKRNFGYVLLIFALGILIPYFIFYFKNRKVLKNLVEEQNAVISIYAQNPKVIMEFTEIEFKFSDFGGESTIAWADFQMFLIIEENIFLFTKNYQPITIGKSEAGEENYAKVLQIIEAKLTR